jgi:hypothetical protein
MDKNIIKKYLKDFVSEAASAPAIKLASKIGKENDKINNAGISAVGKEMKSYEKGLGGKDANEKEMAINKFNYSGKEESDYHAQMEIMNGQEMIQ